MVSTATDFHVGSGLSVPSRHTHAPLLPGPPHRPQHEQPTAGTRPRSWDGNSHAEAAPRTGSEESERASSCPRAGAAFLLP